MTQDSINNFSRPTNQWIEEEIEIPVFAPQVNEDEKRVEFTQTTKKVMQKTYYADSKPNKIICNDHVYTCVNKGTYHFKCTKCDWNKIAPPVSFKFDPETGKLTYRNGGGKV